MLQDKQRKLVEAITQSNIQIYSLDGSNQYVVSTSQTEYYFTKLDDARNFANKLETRRNVFAPKAGSKTANPFSSILFEDLK